MTDRFIDLDDAEFAAAKAAVRDVVNGQRQRDPLQHPALGDYVNAVVDGINRVRSGDPVGTVRWNAGSVAIRRDYGWLLVHQTYLEERNDERNPVDVSEWKIIFNTKGAFTYG